MPLRLARFISFLFHPVFMPTYSLIVLFSLSGYFNFITSTVVKEALFAIIVFNTLLMPLMIIWLLRKRGYIRSFEMNDPHERIIPFFCTAILMFITYYMILRLSLPRIFAFLLLGAASSVIIATLITSKWKVSIHMIGIGGLAGMLFGLTELFMIDFRFPFMVCLLIAGIIGVARLTLQSHKQLQIYTGFLLGFICEYGILQIL